MKFLPIFLLCLCTFQSWASPPTCKDASIDQASYTVNPDSSDYENIICNDWVYNFLNAFTDSCLVDSIVIDTTFLWEIPVQDTVLTFEYTIDFLLKTETCYDLRFGVVELDDEFDHFYYSSTITSWDTLEFHAVAYLDSTLIEFDSIVGSIIPIVAEVAVGIKADLLLDCSGFMEGICFNDMICADILNPVNLNELDTLPDDYEIEIDTMLYEPPEWEIIELWTFENQSQTDCNEDSPRIHPCDTCQAQLVTMVHTLPDSCEQAGMSIAFQGQLDYENCSLENTLLNVNEATNVITLTLDFERAEAFETCTSCGTEYGDTILIGSIDPSVYQVFILNMYNDSLLYSGFIEVVDCNPPNPICPVPEQAFLQTTNISDSSATLNYTGSTLYQGFGWQIKTCDGNNWEFLGTTTLPQIEVENLMPDTSYCWQAYGICGPNFISFWTGDVPFNTLPSPICEVTEDFSFMTHSINSSSALLSFEGETYAEYEWRIKPCNANDWTDLGSTMVPMIWATDLESNTSYCWEVRVRCDNELWSDWFEDELNQSSFTTFFASYINTMNVSSAFDLTPNPFSEKISIRERQASNRSVHFELYNALGQMIYREIFINEIELQSELFESKGIYFIRLTSDEQDYIGRIIKQ